MRSDMSAVIVERPRHRRFYNYHDHRVRCDGLDVEALDNLPKKQGYRRPYLENHTNKELADLTGPLERYLHSKIGEKWDDVYSEIRENLSPNSTTQIHVMGHVFDYVEETTWIGEDGEIWTPGGNRFRNYTGGQPSHVTAGNLYVHPDTGILCEMPIQRAYRNHPGYRDAIKHLRELFGNRWHNVLPDRYSGTQIFGNYRWTKAKKEDNRLGYQDRVMLEAKKHIRVSFEKELHQMDGIWYWVGFAEVPKPFSNTWIDHLGKVHSWAQNFQRQDIITGVTYNDGRYRTSRYQVSRRDLRRYGIRNVA